MTFSHLRGDRVPASERAEDPDTTASDTPTQGAAKPARKTSTRKGQAAPPVVPVAADEPAVAAAREPAVHAEAAPDQPQLPAGDANDTRQGALDGLTAPRELDELSSLQERRVGITGRVPESVKDALEAFMLANKKKIGRKPSADMLVEAWINLTLHDDDTQHKLLLMLREKLNR